MEERYYIKVNGKIHRLYASEKVSRRVWDASIKAKLDKGYELLETESTPHRAVLKKPASARKYIMVLFSQVE